MSTLKRSIASDKISTDVLLLKHRRCVQGIHFAYLMVILAAMALGTLHTIKMREQFMADNPYSTEAA